MTMLWVFIALLTLAALALLLAPLLRPRRATPVRAAYDMEVYRHQIREVARERERGVLDSESAAAARLEIERRMLHAADEVEAAPPEPTATVSTRRRVAVALAVVVPVVAFGLYDIFGTPGLPGQPVAGRKTATSAAAAAARAQVRERVAALKRTLMARPKDRDSWIALARGLRSLGHYAKAANAFSKAIKLANPGAGLLSAYGETLMQAASGVVTPAAQRAFREALRIAPREPRARYYLGLAELQAGQAKAALEMWIALEAESSADAPWLPVLRRRIAAVAKEHRVDLVALRAALPKVDRGKRAAGGTPGPSGEQLEAARRMTPEARAKMIRSMVDRLAARLAKSPDDGPGWRRLGRAYRMLGEKAKAVEAYGKAAALQPKSVDVLLDYGEALLTVGGGKADAKLNADFIGVMRRILALNDRNPVALWYVGLAALQAGQPAAAKRHWQRLFTVIPKEAPERAVLEKRIQALEGASSQPDGRSGARPGAEPDAKPATPKTTTQ